MKTMQLSEFQDAIKAQGVDRQDAAFICLMCKTVQSMRDFIAVGVDQEDAKKNIGFSCIGRKTGAGSPRKLPDGKPCNWSLGGLLRLHEIEVVTPDGTHPFFEIATPEQAQAHAKTHAAEAA
jgi:hypothetical protein